MIQYHENCGHANYRFISVSGKDHCQDFYQYYIQLYRTDWKKSKIQQQMCVQIAWHGVHKDIFLIKLKHEAVKGTLKIIVCVLSRV